MADMFEGFVEVYSTDTGAKQMIPAEWLDHPVLSKGLKPVPSSVASEPGDEPTEGAGNTYTGPAPELPADVEETPTDEWTVDRLKQWATDHGVDLDGATLKADIYAAITDHLAAGEGNPGTAADAGHTEGV